MVWEMMDLLNGKQGRKSKMTMGADNNLKTLLNKMDFSVSTA